MPSVTAKRKCPQLIFVAPRFEVYKSVSAEIRAIFAQYTDLIEPLSLDEAYLDVTANKRGLATATDVARAVKQEIKRQTGLTASAGVSINKFLAKIASDYDKPDGLYVIPPHRAQPFIDALDIERFFGIGKVTAKKMRALGIHKGADLKRWSQQDLVEHFGKAGRYFHAVAHGQDDRPVTPHRVRKSIGAERTFSEDLTSIESLLDALQGIAEEVTRRIDRQQTAGRTVTVKIKFADFSQITRSLSLENTVHDYGPIFDTASYLLQQAFSEGMAIRLLGITVSNLDSADTSISQLTLEL